MLRNARELDGIAAGQVSVVFRRWQQASVHAGLLMPAVTAVPAALWQPVAAVTSGFE